MRRAESLGAGGKELSFNNLVDVDAALDAVREFERPAAVVVKHTNPCGVAVADALDVAYKTARDADPLSAFGGIVALNREVDEADGAAARRDVPRVRRRAGVQPGGALEVLRAKKNLRLLATRGWLGADHAALQFKRVGGGIVAQDARRHGGGRGDRWEGRDQARADGRGAEVARVRVARLQARQVERDRPRAQGERTVGVGAGQMSRVVSVQIACEKAGALAKGSVLASDAFFPFPDGLEAAAKAGVTAVAQPGGSVKDADVIAAADAHGIALVMTGVRHFRH